MNHDPRVAAAAANNADLYQAVFDSWGLPYRHLRHAFAADGATPPFYGQLVTLAPGPTAAVEHEVARLGGLAFKDSFGDVDLPDRTVGEALAAGFAPIGDLRVMIARPPSTE